MDGVADDGATGEGDQVVWGRLVGGRAADVLIGGAQDDVLVGGPGDDRLDGGRGIDDVRGDDRFLDRYVETRAGEVFHGGTGTDTVSYATRTRGVWAVLGVHPELTHPTEHDLLLGVERNVGTRSGTSSAAMTGPTSSSGARAVTCCAGTPVPTCCARATGRRTRSGAASAPTRRTPIATTTSPVSSADADAVPPVGEPTGSGRMRPCACTSAPTMPASN